MPVEIAIDGVANIDTFDVETGFDEIYGLHKKVDVIPSLGKPAGGVSRTGIVGCQCSRGAAFKAIQLLVKVESAKGQAHEGIKQEGGLIVGPA